MDCEQGMGRRSQNPHEQHGGEASTETFSSSSTFHMDDDNNSDDEQLSSLPPQHRRHASPLELVALQVNRAHERHKHKETLVAPQPPPSPPPPAVRRKQQQQPQQPSSPPPAAPAPATTGESKAGEEEGKNKTVLDVTVNVDGLEDQMELLSNGAIDVDALQEHILLNEQLQQLQHYQQPEQGRKSSDTKSNKDQTAHRNKGEEKEEHPATTSRTSIIHSSKQPTNTRQHRVNFPPDEKLVEAILIREASSSSSSYEEEDKDKVKVATADDDDEGNPQYPRNAARQIVTIQSAAANDNNETETTQTKTKKKKNSLAKEILRSRSGMCMICIFLFAVSLIVVGITLGLTGGTRTTTQKTTATGTFIQTGSSTSTPMIPSFDDDDDEVPIGGRDSTKDPMLMDTSPPRPPGPPPVAPAPTPAPISPAPTTVAQGSFVETLLPQYTQQALQDPQSPQSQALNWLLEEHDDDQLANFSQTRLVTRFALATLYYALHGIGWRYKSYWLSPHHHECTWWSHLQVPGSPPGQICQSINTTNNEQWPDYELTALLLNDNLLRGTLPKEVALISNLQEISLTADTFGVNPADKRHLFIRGGIPTEWGAALTRLTRLDLSKQALSGTIPSELGLLQNLTSLRLLENDLRQTLPTEVGQLSNLEHMWLYGNRLRGTLPSELGRLSSRLAALVVTHNRFTGTAPTQLGHLTQLTNLQAEDNQLTGPLPTELGHLNASLQFLKLGDNLLTGTYEEKVCVCVCVCVCCHDVVLARYT
jgi:hypothetical protein